MAMVIKFRVWSVQQKKILNPEHYIIEFWNGKYFVRIPDYKAFDSYIYERNPDPILMLWTGLMDKHGKEIYEGDILEDNEYPEEGISRAKVEWENAGWVVDPWFETKEFAEEAENYEVIGNIYESKHLLLEGKL